MKKTINVWVQIKEYWVKKTIDYSLIFEKKAYNLVLRYHCLKSNKRTVPNKKVLAGKNSVINKPTAYVY